MAYGSSGSGKTFTLHGKKDNPGIISRYLEYIFSTFDGIEFYPKLKPYANFGAITLSKEESIAEYHKKMDLLHDADQFASYFSEMRINLNLSSRIVMEMSDYFSIWISFIEIYNENVYDLLTNTKKCLKIKKNVDQEPYIEDINLITVSNSIEAYQLLMYGMKNLTYAATNINSHSSRSHSLFTVYLVQKIIHNDNQVSKISKMTFCDLAGCERVNDSKNIGVRLIESKNINKSLFNLKRCFDVLLKHKNNLDQCLIPYRDSKLTLILHEALIAKESLTVIVNISSSSTYHSITLNTLEFSSIAKQVLHITRKHQNNKLTQIQELEHGNETSSSDNNRHSYRNISVNDFWKQMTHEDLRYAFLENQNLKLKIDELRNEIEKRKIDYDQHIDRFIENYSKLVRKRIDDVTRKESDRIEKEIEKLRNDCLNKQKVIRDEIETIKKMKSV